MRKTLCLAAAALLLTAFAGDRAGAQNAYPTRAVTVLVPAAAGGIISGIDSYGTMRSSWESEGRFVR